MADLAETAQLRRSVVKLEMQLSDSAAEAAWLRERADEFRKSVIVLVTTKDLSKVPKFTLGKRPLIPASGGIKTKLNSESNAGESTGQLRKRQAELKRKLKDSKNRYTELKAKVDNFRKTIITLANKGRTQSSGDDSDGEEEYEHDKPNAGLGQEDTEGTSRETAPVPGNQERNVAIPGSSSGKGKQVFTAPKDQRVKFQCDLCITTCSSIYNLQRHRATVHKIQNSSKSYCVRCSALFESRNELRDHQREKHAVIGLKRKKTPKKSVALQDDMVKQSTKHRIREPDPREQLADYFCVCGARFTKRKAILKHIRLKNRGKIYKCQFCSYRNEELDVIKRHEERKHQEKSTA